MSPDNAKELLKKIKANGKADLTDEERNAIKRILKDSLTFD